MIDEIDGKILEFIRERVVEDGTIPSAGEIREHMGFISLDRTRSRLENLLLRCLESWEMEDLRPCRGSEPGDAASERFLRNQISLLGSSNRALEKQNENLHRRVEHLREQLKSKVEEVERLRQSLSSRPPRK